MTQTVMGSKKLGKKYFMLVGGYYATKGHVMIDMHYTCRANYLGVMQYTGMP